jgi:hypothetical protein
MSEVFFEIQSSLPLDTSEDARRLLGLWAECAPGFFPDRTGSGQPLREKLSSTAVEVVLKHWWSQCMLKRVAPPKLDASIFMRVRPHTKHSDWSIGLDKLQDYNPDAFYDLLRRSAVVFKADFGLIHCLTEADMTRGRENGTVAYLNTAKTEKNLFVPSIILKRYIPDVYWITLFGAPYVRLFSRQRLLSAPVHRVDELENGSIILQLTTHLADTVTDEAAFEHLRSSVRKHLNCDAIFDEKKGPQYAYRVPRFEWEPLRQEQFLQ